MRSEETCVTREGAYKGVTLLTGAHTQFSILLSQIPNIAILACWSAKAFTLSNQEACLNYRMAVGVDFG